MFKQSYTFFIFGFLTLAMLGSIEAIRDHTVKYRAGKKAFLAGNHEKAGELLKEFMKEEPFEYEIRDALYYMGEIYRTQKDYLNAVSYYNRLSKRFPHSRYRTALIYLYGHCYYHMELRVKSERYLSEYLKAFPEPGKRPDYFIGAHDLLGKIKEDKRLWKEAVEHYRKALLVVNNEKLKSTATRERKQNLRESKRNLHRSLGFIFADHIRNPEEAYHHLSAAVKLGEPMTTKLEFLLRRLTLLHIGKKNGLPDDAISDIQVDGDDVWISTWGGGLVRFSRSTEEFIKVPVPSSQLRNLYVDFELVYITSYDGIFVLDKKSNTIYRLTHNDKIFTLAQKVFKDDRVIYFSTLSEGVVKYDTIRKSVEVLNEESFIGSRQVYAIEADHRYTAFGTLDHGVVLQEKKSGKIHHINSANGKLKGDNIKALLLDGRYLWIGIHNHGISRYDIQNKTIKHFDWDLPYPSSLALRGKKVWIGTSGNGIRIYDRETRRLEKITVLDGLSSNEVHLLKMEDNYVWIGYLDNGIDILYRPEQD